MDRPDVVGVELIEEGLTKLETNELVIYGKGKKYIELFENTNIWEETILGCGYKIVAFLDNRSIEEVQRYQSGFIVVTSSVHFDEIKNDLISVGVSDNRIIVWDMLIQDLQKKCYCIERYSNKNGIEIGGPSSVFKSIYYCCNSCDNVVFSLNTVWKTYESEEYLYKGKKLGSVIEADVVDLSLIPDERYEFVVSSNNIEHIANPIKALLEMARILKKGGCLLLAAPRKEKTFDHARDYTTFEHILDDYHKNVSEEDLTHLPEIEEKHDYEMDYECGGKEAFLERAKENYNNRCLHHHVFCPEVLRKLYEYVGISIIREAIYGNNFVIVGVKNE